MDVASNSYNAYSQHFNFCYTRNSCSASNLYSFLVCQSTMENGKQSILIIGIDGQIGSALFNNFLKTDTYRITGTSRKKEACNSQIEYLDLSNIDNNLLLYKHYDFVICCAGITKINECELYFNNANIVNVENPLKLINNFSNKGSRIIFLSSSAVFDGFKQFNSVMDKPNPISLYGKQKLAVENEVVKCKNSIILRLTKVISSSTPFVKKWIDQCKNNEEIIVYEDLFISPIILEDVIRIINKLIGLNASGIYQFGSKEEISYADYAKKLFVNNNHALSLIRIVRQNQGTDRKNIYGSLKTHLPKGIWCD